MANAVTRVILRCETAQENNSLGIQIFLHTFNYYFNKIFFRFVFKEFVEIVFIIIIKQL